MLIDTMKKVAVIITIAILFTVFTMSSVDVVNQEPSSSDYCESHDRPYYPTTADKVECEEIVEPTPEERKECSDKDGRIEYIYEKNCPVSFECETCWAEFNAANEKHRMIGFIITTIFGLIAIIVGLYAESRNEVIQWLYSGFMIGGIISIFIGTISYYHDMEIYVRPLVMLLEIGLICWVAIRTYNKSQKNTKTKKKK